jgi:hypothetical protein
MILSIMRLNQVLQVEKQKDKKMKDLAKQETKAVAIPAEFQGFTEEEALGGMNPIQEGYLKSYKYFLSRPSTLGKFQIVDNDTDQVAWEGDKIENAVIYYGHEVMRLKRGHVEAPGKQEADFTDEENEILAVTYDRASRGNFDANGYGQFLSKDHEDIHGKMTRLYIIMLIPSLKDKIGLELIAASFSVTTIKSFRDLMKLKKQYNVPLPYLYANIFFKEDKSEKGQVYQRIVFDFPKAENGFPKPVHKSREAYLESPRGLTMLNEVIETHKGAVEYAEKSYGGASVVVEKEGIPSYSDIAAESKSTFTDVDHLADTVKSQFKGTEVDPNSDEMPF